MDRVWRALTEVDEVTRWAGVTPVVVPSGYPAAGQHAIWRDHGRLLHDVIVTVDAPRRLTSWLGLGPAWAVEDYVLTPAGAGRTQLRAQWRGTPALAAGNEAAMARLSRVCRERP